jgi:hypothetical protein
MKSRFHFRGLVFVGSLLRLLAPGGGSHRKRRSGMEQNIFFSFVDDHDLPEKSSKKNKKKVRKNLKKTQKKGRVF